MVKEFYTITTADESVFYLVIDKQKTSENVYFLNTVTTDDLLPLAEQGKEPPKEVTPEPEPKPTEPVEEVPEPEPEKKDSPLLSLLLIGAVVLAGGGIGYYFKIYKPKHEAPDLEDDYCEYEDGELEEIAEEPEDEDTPPWEPNMEFIREDCIYARQSVDRKDSISIESQIDFCKYELKGGSCRVFKDKGYSGKNTDRPEFQKLLGEIRKGKVRRVIVYKLDRISRSILDFATMMELFQEYDVEFVSSTEKFDTSTPMGRAMLNICIVFAQLERETIQKRVTDAYYSRCLKGFHMSGQAPYGYQLEPTVVEGIRTKKMVADPVAADHVRLMFEMYAEPETSFGDITRYFEEHDIKIYGKSMFRTFLSQLLRNPVYAQADLELYEFFKSQGAAIVNDASDFAGTNGCYLYQGRDVKEDKDRCLKDQILVIAPHEALISSDTWLKCRKKLMANTTFQQGRKPKNTWLAGKIKCGHCGYALKATHVPNSTGYFRCTKRTENKGCPGCGKIRKEEFEQFIFSAMQEKFKDFQILHGREEKVNPKLTAYQVELAQVEAEIEKLLDTLTGANATLLAYANKKIEELDTRRQTISKAIAELSVETISPQQIKKLSYYLDNWDSIDFDDKRKAADGLISTIKATSDRVQIEWKI